MTLSIHLSEKLTKELSQFFAAFQLISLFNFSPSGILLRCHTSKTAPLIAYLQHQFLRNTP
ncbi:MAG: hypothetical protein XXXJIFNMEKO3_02895 [Candidatus Erwinia impunctatus]|nr:hypothetical protein XXXJIFNMEKO_02895 [Culicoides impunctatus]